MKRLEGHAKLRGADYYNVKKKKSMAISKTIKLNVGSSFDSRFLGEPGLLLQI